MEKIDLAIKNYDGNVKDGIKIIKKITQTIEKIKVISTDAKESLKKIEEYAEKIYDKIKNSKKEETFFYNVYENINIQWGKSTNIFSKLKELLTDNKYQQCVNKMSKAYKLKQDELETLWKSRLRKMINELDKYLVDLWNCLAKQWAIIAKAKKDGLSYVDLSKNEYFIKILENPIKTLTPYVDLSDHWYDLGYTLKDCRDVLDDAGKFGLNMLISSVNNLIDELKEEYKDSCESDGLVRVNNIKDNFYNSGDWLKEIDEDSMENIIKSIKNVLKRTQMMIKDIGIRKLTCG